MIEFNAETMALSNSAESDIGWVHPFECNTLEDKISIVEFMIEVRYMEPFTLSDESNHLDVCRQLAGGC